MWGGDRHAAPGRTPEARPAPSEFDNDLPPPPRMPYQPARRPSRSRTEDTELGSTAFVWFFLIEMLVNIGLFLYLTTFESDPAWATRNFFIVSGIMVLISMILHLWGFFWLLSFAFREDFMRGLFCLFVPFYVFIFAGSRWQERRGTVGLMLAYPLALLFAIVLGLMALPGLRERLFPPGAAAPGFARTMRPRATRSSRIRRRGAGERGTAGARRMPTKSGWPRGSSGRSLCS